jgi:ABC-type polysaccharide transport system permease subunit
MAILLIAIVFRVVFEATKSTDTQRPVQVAEEVNTYVEKKTANEVARGGTNTVLFKHETGMYIIYFSNQGGVWGHPK